MLLLAEVKMHLGKDAEAIALLDEVRLRAGLPSYAVSRTNASYAAKYPTLKDAILHERRVELAFENHRWFDLIRNYDANGLVDYFKRRVRPTMAMPNYPILRLRIAIIRYHLTSIS